MEYDLLQMNQRFLSHIGLLSLIGIKGPMRNLHFNPLINNVKVIDDPAEVKAGDLAYSAYMIGVVTSNEVDGNIRTISAKYGPIDRPAGMSNEEYIADYQNLAFETKQFVISEEENTNADTGAYHDPYKKILPFGAVFARKIDVIYNPAEYNDILLASQNLPFIEGKDFELVFNIGNVNVQLQVNGVASGNAVTANNNGEVTVVNPAVEGDTINFIVTKKNHSQLYLGSYVLGAAV